MVSDWPQTPLCDLTESNTPVTYGVVKPGKEDPEGVLFIRGGDIADGRILTQQLRTISKDVSHQYRRTLLRGGELVMSLVGNPGQVAIVPASLEGSNIARQAALIRLRAEVDARFVMYFLNSRVGQEELGAHSRGSVQQVINLRDLKTVRIPTPPLPQQRAIAFILGALDDKIELNRQMNETLETMARSLFKSWFVDFDPLRAKAEGRSLNLPETVSELFPITFEDFGSGIIPKGWEAIPAYDIATFVNGAAYANFEPNTDRIGLPIIKIAELKAGVTAQTGFSTVEMPEKYRMDTGDILFSWSGNPDTSIDTFVWAHGPAWLNQHIFKVVPPKAELRAFILMTLRYLRPVFAEIARNKQTTGLGHVTVADLKRLMIVRPPTAILLAWNKFVEPLIERSFGIQLENNTLAALRDTLLPKLISGELRVQAAEKIVEAVA